jgi:hypothetical protein
VRSALAVRRPRRGSCSPKAPFRAAPHRTHSPLQTFQDRAPGRLPHGILPCLDGNATADIQHFRAEAQRGQPQLNTRLEQATEETERRTMASDALFSLFSPVQKHLVPKAKFHGPAPRAAIKTLPEGTCARRGAEVAEEDCITDFLSYFSLRSGAQYPDFTHLIPIIWKRVRVGIGLQSAAKLRLAQGLSQPLGVGQVLRASGSQFVAQQQVFADHPNRQTVDFGFNARGPCLRK